MELAIPMLYGAIGALILVFWAWTYHAAGVEAGLIDYGIGLAVAVLYPVLVLVVGVIFLGYIIISLRTALIEEELRRHD